MFRDEFGARKSYPPHFTRGPSLKSLHILDQVLAQWILATFISSPEELVRFVGIATSVLAGGIATSLGIEAAELMQLHFMA